MFSRRSFVCTALGSAGAAVALNCAALPSGPAQGRRPKAPYRVWFQPHLYLRDIDLYENMTIDASGWVDPRLLDKMGKTTLGWAYGPNHPSAKGPDYWAQACSPQARAWPRKSTNPNFVSAGIALDEWVPPKLPDNIKWMSEGLRAGRKANPDVFIAIWCTAPGPALFELMREGSVDLAIIEGYTHSTRQGLSTNWDVALRRCEAFANADLLPKTIFCFGHITAQASHRGTHLTQKWLREHAEEIKRKYPAMPGIAFYSQNDFPDTLDQRTLIRFCDRLSGELWPG